VSEGEGSNVIKAHYIDLKYQGETFLDYQYTLNLKEKNEGQEGK
jgi:hypothetical protein